jgi:hypothetical protein
MSAQSQEAPIGSTEAAQGPELELVVDNSELIEFKQGLAMWAGVLSMDPPEFDGASFKDRYPKPAKWDADLGKRV